VSRAGVEKQGHRTGSEEERDRRRRYAAGNRPDLTTPTFLGRHRPLPPFPDDASSPAEERYKNPDRTTTPSRVRRPLFPGESCHSQTSRAAGARLDTGLVTPEVRYARSGDVSIAYQVVGDGPFDLVWTPGALSHLPPGSSSSTSRARSLRSRRGCLRSRDAHGRVVAVRGRLARLTFGAIPSCGEGRERSTNLTVELEAEASALGGDSRACTAWRRG
jgi:hypothetical protein